MKQYGMTVESSHPYGNRVPAQLCGQLLQFLPKVVSQSVRMRLQGRSVSRGRKPEWLLKAADVRFTSLQQDEIGYTRLNFDAPTIAESANELFREPRMWPDHLTSDATGIDVFLDVLRDVKEIEEDSRATGRYIRSGFDTGRHERQMLRT